jgi:hypothetical protein
VSPGDDLSGPVSMGVGSTDELFSVFAGVEVSTFTDSGGFSRDIDDSAVEGTCHPPAVVFLVSPGVGGCIST